MDRYPIEHLAEDRDDGTMPDNLAELREAVVGHRIVKTEHRTLPGRWYGNNSGFVITLDNGKEVRLAHTSDCCAYTEVEAFLLNPELVNHIVIGVGTTDGFTTWHIYADLGDILKLTIGWSAGNPFYYGYGFDISVVDIEQVTTASP